MSLNVGELFVNLGIKGSEKTVGAITNVRKGLGETASMGIETKAAILGAAYALERLFAASSAQGTMLTNFNALTGLSAKQLQQWQYAAIQAGGSASSMTQTVMAMQKAMAGIDLAKGVPEGLTLLSQAAGGIDFSKKDDPFYMLAAINKGVKNLGNSPRAKAIESYLTASMGISPDVLAGMQRGLFNDNVFKKAPTYSDREIAQLDKANIAWANLGQKIEMAIGHFNAAHGGQLVKDIGAITEATIHLATALETVTTKLGAFERTAHALEGVANTIKLISEVVDKVTGKDSKPGDLLYQKPNSEAVPGFDQSIIGRFMRSLFGIGDTGEALIKAGLPAGLPHLPVFGLPFGGPDVARPRSFPLPASSGGQNIQIKQDLHFQHDGKDHKRTGESVKKANQDAFRQFNQGQAS